MPRGTADGMQGWQSDQSDIPPVGGDFETHGRSLLPISRPNVVYGEGSKLSRTPGASCRMQRRRRRHIGALLAVAFVHLASSLPTSNASAEETRCGAGNLQTCRCLLGCQVFGRSPSSCKGGSEDEEVVREAMLSAAHRFGTECESMQCIVTCSRVVGCLDATVTKMCLNVKSTLPMCEVACEDTTTTTTVTTTTTTTTTTTMSLLLGFQFVNSWRHVALWTLSASAVAAAFCVCWATMPRKSDSQPSIGYENSVLSSSPFTGETRSTLRATSEEADTFLRFPCATVDSGL